MLGTHPFATASDAFSPLATQIRGAMVLAVIVGALIDVARTGSAVYAIGRARNQARAPRRRKIPC